jgi:biotin-(acetyl-CoA carboxylase) ligase
VLRGRSVAVALGRETLEGMGEGIDAGGALRLRLGNGRVQPVHAGEASVRRAGEGI